MLRATPPSAHRNCEADTYARNSTNLSIGVLRLIAFCLAIAAIDAAARLPEMDPQRQVHARWRRTGAALMVGMRRAPSRARCSCWARPNAGLAGGDAGAGAVPACIAHG